MALCGERPAMPHPWDRDCHPTSMPDLGPPRNLGAEIAGPCRLYRRIVSSGPARPFSDIAQSEVDRAIQNALGARLAGHSPTARCLAERPGRAVRFENAGQR